MKQKLYYIKNETAEKAIVGEAACRLRISKTYFRTGQKKNGN